MSQESSRVVWYSHLLQNFPQFAVIHTVKGFGVVNKAEVDIFLEFLNFPFFSGTFKFIIDKKKIWFILW